MTILAQTHLRGPDYFILVSYFALMLGIGAYFYRYMKGMKDYFTGGNRIPWWLSGVSYYMASFSAFAFVNYSAIAYRYGGVALSMYWVTVPAALFSVLFFATRWRRARVVSPVEYLEARYNSAVRQLFAWQGVPVKIIDDALKIVAIGTLLSLGLGLESPKQGMFWSSVIMLAYTFMGGLWAAAVTDFVQFVVLLAAVIIILPLSISHAGGLHAFVHNSPEGFFRLTGGEFTWLYLGSLIFLYTLSWSINWGLVQKFYCVPKERDAIKVGWLVVALNLITTPVMFLPAMAARHFLPPLADSTWVYPKMCLAILPVGMMGLMLAAMFSATMSMLSSDYNVCASVLTNDIYNRLLRPKAGHRELVFVGRLTTLLVGALSIGVAFLLSSGKDAAMFKNMVTLFSAAVPPVAIPMLWGLVSSRLSSRGALLGFVLGLCAGIGLLVGMAGIPEGESRRLAGFLLEKGRLGIGAVVLERENAIFWLSAAVTLLSVLAGNVLFPQAAADLERAEKFLARIRVPIGQLEQDQVAGTEPGRLAISPFRVTGICVSLIGVLILGILPWAREPIAIGLDAAIGLFLAVAGVLMFRRSRPAVSPADRKQVAERRT
ncbi:MAG: sodium:solute symporter family transporter [Phycisphaerae bacterium]